MTFYDQLRECNFAEVADSYHRFTEQDVQKALRTARPTLQDFAALISPAALPFLDLMATKARALSLEKYGRTIQMYVPLYLSNYCSNGCVYCGFNSSNHIHRKKLSLEEVEEEAWAIKKLGFEHILLVAGEAPALAGVDYYKEVVELLRPLFAQISIEVQPLHEVEYATLVEAGVTAVSVYQETYNETNYPIYHPRGMKSNFRFRLETPERAAAAGMKKVGIGALLGLDDWYADAYCTAMHLRYMEKHYWRTKYALSLPRLRPHLGGYMPKKPIEDKEVAQLICAFRIFSPQIEINLSTRESTSFRDMAMRLGANTMSAGSSTQPGGYAHPDQELEQFSINDSRTPKEFEQAIVAQGYEPVWKDWDSWM